MTKLQRKQYGRTADEKCVDIFIGKRLCERRQVLCMTQEKLAILLGVSFQKIQKYESTCNRMAASRLYKAADVLQTQVAAFYPPLPSMQALFNKITSGT